MYYKFGYMVNNRKDIDTLWKNFILSKSYLEFCLNCYGEYLYYVEFDESVDDVDKKELLKNIATANEMILKERNIHNKYFRRDDRYYNDDFDILPQYILITYLSANNENSELNYYENSYITSDNLENSELENTYSSSDYSNDSYSDGSSD